MVKCWWSLSTGQTDTQETSLLPFSYPCFSVAGTLILQDSQLQPKGEQFVSESCMLQLPFHKLASILFPCYFDLVSYLSYSRGNDCSSEH